MLECSWEGKIQSTHILSERDDTRDLNEKEEILTAV